MDSCVISFLFLLSPSFLGVRGYGGLHQPHPSTVHLKAHLLVLICCLLSLLLIQNHTQTLDENLLSPLLGFRPHQRLGPLFSYFFLFSWCCVVMLPLFLSLHSLYFFLCSFFYQHSLGIFCSEGRVCVCVCVSVGKAATMHANVCDHPPWHGARLPQPLPH